MYSKKVMDLFFNPKNMGEIKNADGVGKVGNPVCLLPNEMLHKNPNLTKISQLEKGNKILTHTGHYEKVIGKFSRTYKGKIIRLKNSLGKINLTPEHLVFAIKIPKGDKFLRNKWRRTLVHSWYHVEDLKKGDIVLYPISKEEEDIKFLEINIPKLKYDFKSKKLPKRVPINSELLKLFGYFLSEGNVQDKPSNTYISFTLNIKENYIVGDIKKIVKDLFNIEIKVKKIPKRNTIVVYVYNARLSRWFKELFGNGASNKKIPKIIMELPIKKQKYLIIGLWRGDGYINLNRKGQRAGYATISYHLAQQIKILLLRQNIFPSIYEEEEKERKGVKHKKAYRIHVGQRESLKRLCDILNLKYYSNSSYEAIMAWFDKNYLYTPITKKEILDYKGKVHNLEVESSHSFVSDAFCLHNCGDIMWIYIKVKKNEKGEEVIKNIKFKTLGCAAAIATSSMITDLVKGKTLGEAMKVGSNSVADALEGLPPIKMHCSNLAANALHKAIEDYGKKKK